jgi:hypothetical protein
MVPIYCGRTAVPKRRDLHLIPDVSYHTDMMKGMNKIAVMRLIRERGLIRPKDLEGHGITRTQLGRLMAEGLVVR